MLRIYFVQICFLILCSRVGASDEVKGDKGVTVDCSTLRLGQYICPDPNEDQIDPDTQQFKGCVKGKDIPSEGEADGTPTTLDNILNEQFGDITSHSQIYDSFFSAMYCSRRHYLQ